jgi:hypothetical protein
MKSSDKPDLAAKGPLTRRRFLQVLGTVGGAGAVLATMEALDLVPSAREHTTPFQPPRASDFALQGRANDTTVLVLGGGIAGLCVAYELERPATGARSSRHAIDRVAAAGQCGAEPGRPKWTVSPKRPGSRTGTT